MPQDKLTAVRIKQQNGQYGPQIPVGAKAENVKYDNMYSVKEVLGNVKTNIGPLQEQIDNIDTEAISGAVTDWLEDNPGALLPTDKTLSIADAPADAQQAGKVVTINSETDGNATKLHLNTTNDIVNVLTTDDIDPDDLNNQIDNLETQFNNFSEGLTQESEIEITNLIRHQGYRYGADGSLITNTPSIGTSEAVEISVIGGEEIRWVCYYANRNATYNVKYLMINDSIVPDTNYTTAGNEYSFIVPEGCKKLLISCWVLATTGNHFYETITELVSVKTYVDNEILNLNTELSADIADIEEEVDTNYQNLIAITDAINDKVDTFTEDLINETEVEITNLTRNDGYRYGADGTLIANTPTPGRSEAVEIPVSGGENIRWVCYYANRNSTYNVKYLMSDNSIVPDTNYTESGNEYTFTVPEDCVKLLVSCWVLNTVGNLFYQIITETISVKTYVDTEILELNTELSADISQNETAITNLQSDVVNTYMRKVDGIKPDYPTLFNADNIITGYWYDYTDSGKLKTSGSRFIQPLVPCKASTKYSKRNCNICIYAADKTYISTIMWNDPGSFTTPVNAAYFGVSMTTANLSQVRLIEGDFPTGDLRQPGSAISPEQIKTVIVNKTGIGDYTSLTEAMRSLVNEKAIIHVLPGEYDLITEFETLYGNDYFDNVSFSDEGLVINNETEVILDSTAIVKFNYTGNNTRVTQYFSPFKFSGNGGKLKGGQVICSNCRYAIHDDTYSSAHDKRIIDGVYIYYRSERNVAIGGGLGYSSDVELKNCYVDSGSIGYGVFYHNASYADAQNIVKIHDNYFTAGIFIEPYGPSTLISRALVSNNKASIVGRITSEMTTDNFELVEWNNVTN